MHNHSQLLRLSLSLSLQALWSGDVSLQSPRGASSHQQSWF